MSVIVTNMKQEFEYRIEYAKDNKTGQITAVIPELNHVASFGDTFAEAESNVKEAAMCYIETLLDENRSIPEPSFHTEGTYLKLFVPKLA